MTYCTGSPLLLCEGFLSSFPVGSCRSFAWDLACLRMLTSLGCKHDPLALVIIVISLVSYFH